MRKDERQRTRLSGRGSLKERIGSENKSIKPEKLRFSANGKPIPKTKKAGKRTVLLIVKLRIKLQFSISIILQ